jgi:hypothetical protein
MPTEREILQLLCDFRGRLGRRRLAHGDGGARRVVAVSLSSCLRWMEQNGLRPGGAPWVWFGTDPVEHPDPTDWRTEVYWPVAR